MADITILMKGPGKGNLPGIKILSIPPISVAVDSTTSLASYVQDPNGLVSSSQLLENDGPLVSTEISYSHNNGSYTITGITAGTISNLKLEVTY